MLSTRTHERPSFACANPPGRYTLRHVIARRFVPPLIKDQTMSKSTPELRITDFSMDLRPGTEKVPLSPLVYTLTAHLNDAALTKSVLAVLGLGKSKMPMEVDLEGAKFVSGGAEVTVNAGSVGPPRQGNRRRRISANDAETGTVEIREIKALGKLPIESIAGPILDKALDKAAAFPASSRTQAKAAVSGSTRTSC